MFKYERDSFILLKGNLTDKLKDHLLIALKTLLNDYNTTIYENRFIVGGAVEYFIYIILKKINLSVSMSGDESIGGDIRFNNGKQISIKSSFTKSTPTIRLINTMGDSRNAIWDIPTIFIIASKGIGYADQLLIDKKYLQKQKDCLILKTKGLYEYWENNNKHFIEINIPTKKQTLLTGDSKKASNEIAKKIINDKSLFE